VSRSSKSWINAVDSDRRVSMEPWQAYSKDPNSPEVSALRRKVIARTRTGSLVSNRVAYLCGLAAGKSVLDIGVVEHTAGAAEHPDWLHGNLRRHAAECLGVDVLEPEIGKLRARGYNVICADVTREPLTQTFDVIIGGEVIEHLDAPGRFMQSCASMLRPGGRLVITAPNPWHANAILKNSYGRGTFVDSADHVAWYEPSVLYELGQRHGLMLDRFAGIGGAQPRGVMARAFFGLRPVLIALGLRPELFAKSIIYEFVLVSDGKAATGAAP
jgi:2-polyprenyl-3-methyl-5-hydroxy-6-metoxy-1,4-benzoquinol methylase